MGSPCACELKVPSCSHANVFVPQELLNLNIIKGATEVVGSQTLMGRAMIHISRFSEDPCEQFDDW